MDKISLINIEIKTEPAGLAIALDSPIRDVRFRVG
jgi:hypothetical protein